MEQAAPFAHISDELVALAARINAHREASSCVTAVHLPLGSRETASVGPQQGRQHAGLQSPHGRPAHGAQIVWDAGRLQCVWRYVQLYHVQLNGQLPDLKKLVNELGMSDGGRTGQQ